MLNTEQTTFTRDVFGRYLCNTFAEAMDSTKTSLHPKARLFDIVIIGGGSFGAALAEQLFQLDKGRRHRILVLEGGPFLLPEHIQNLPAIRSGIGTPGATTIAELRQDWQTNHPGQPSPALLPSRLEVWGLAWHSRAGANATDPKDKRFPGLAYCIGGRSLFWGGWSPELVDSELTQWPPSVVTDLKAVHFKKAAAQLGSDIANDFIFGSLHDALRARLFLGLSQVTTALPPANAVGLEAPLAVEARPGRSGFFPFNKFSSGPLLLLASRLAQDEAEKSGLPTEQQPVKKRLMIVPNCHVIQLHRDGNNRVRRVRTNLGDVFVDPNAAVILAQGTIESTRQALLASPNQRGLIGRNLMAHLRSNTTIRIPRSALPALPPELQASALFVKGRAANGGHYHLQITACGVQGDVRDSEVEMNKKLPDIDGMEAFQLVTDDFVVLTLRGIGEMIGDKMAAATSRVELDPELDEHGVPRAIVTIGLKQADLDLWDAMDTAAVEAAKVLADAGPLEYLNEASGQWQAQPWIRRDGLGTTHHEAGTLWMGTDPATSVTDTDGCSHEVTNLYAVGPSVFPTIGSPNPMLGGVALLRRMAETLIPPATAPVIEPGFTGLFDGTSTAGWQMAGPGEFDLVDGMLTSEGGMGLLWFKTKAYKNFILRLDWRANRPDDNSGVFVRFPNPGSDPWVAANQGYEIQIDDFGQPDNAPVHLTAGVYGFAGPTRLASRLVGEWNSLEVRANGQQYTVVLNGREVTNFTGDRGLQGHIGLQNHHTGSRVSFRNIRIKELP